MTFQVFVGYGDIILARQVAVNLGSYLHRSGINTFVASTDPRWMLPGYNIRHIYQKLLNSDILVATCTRNTLPTSKLGREIRLARSNKIPIVPFLEKGMTAPFGLQRVWCIMFDPSRPWTQHRNIALYIRCLIEKNMETRAQVI